MYSSDFPKLNTPSTNSTWPLPEVPLFLQVKKQPGSTTVLAVTGRQPHFPPTGPKVPTSSVQRSFRESIVPEIPLLLNGAVVCQNGGLLLTP